ncbi:MAG: hypothetical protein LVQ75_01965 [Candidatus Babeliales bacterium]
MMKVNQLLMSFLLVFSFVVNNSLDGAQTPQTNFAKAMGFFKNLWAVARNRGTEEQERMYRATLAGIDFADSISGLLKEKEPSEFMQMLSFIFEDSPLSTTDVISNTIKTQAQKNLEAFVEWYIERQVQHFITEINPNNAPITEIQEKNKSKGTILSKRNRASGQIIKWKKYSLRTTWIMDSKAICKNHTKNQSVFWRRTYRYFMASDFTSRSRKSCSRKSKNA